MTVSEPHNVLNNITNNLSTENIVTVSVIKTDTIDPQDAFDRYSSILSSDELSNYHKFRFLKDRHLYLLAHVMLRKTLSRKSEVHPSEWKFILAHNGKPLIKEPSKSPQHFSLSHSHKIAVCAISNNGPIGVDVEPNSSFARLHHVLPKVFSKREQEYLAKCSNHELESEVTSLWTLKEAFLKAIGLGLQVPMHKVCLDTSGPRVKIRALPCEIEEDLNSWELFGLNIDSAYECALCIPRFNCRQVQLQLLGVMTPEFNFYNLITEVISQSGQC